MSRNGVLISVLLVTVKLVSASITDTIIALDPVVTKGVKFENISVGAKLVPIDSFQIAMNQMQSVAELFAQQSLVTVTSYGPGGQAGVKIRGGNADHTTIIWNGLNLKPPMSGELNYSNVVTGAFDQIEIQPGGSSTMYGSGAATGVVFLSNSINLNDKGTKFKAGIEGGSYNSYGLNGDIAHASDNFGTRLFIGHQHSDNNFGYTYGEDQKIQQHAAATSNSINQQNIFKLSKATRLETDIWFTELHKDFPAKKSDTKEGLTEQDDKNFNLAINLSHYLTNGYIKYRGGVIWYYNDFLGYDSTYYNAVNRSNSYINEIETKYNISSNHSLFLGVNHTFDKAYSDSYISDASRNQLDFFGRYAMKFLQTRLLINLEGRQAITDGDAQPFIYSGGAEYRLVSSFSLKAAASKLYSLPDLNDLYWGRTVFAVGNPNLLPESGWSAEAGITEQHQFWKMQVAHELTIYQNLLNQAIVWLPNENNLWTPINVEGTKTSGLEFTGNLLLNAGKSTISLQYDYAYTDARIQDSTKSKEELVQKPYIPKHKAGINIKYQYSSYSVALFTQYVSERYYDNVSRPLKPYLLLDLYVNYSFKIKNTDLLTYFKCKNVLDTDYEIMNDYAQPGRSYYIGTNIKF